MTKDWSMPLEEEDYEEDLELLIGDAIHAVENTYAGHYVNLVTASCYGNPEEYLVPVLTTNFSDKIKTKYIDQCGCGGYVLRVWKL